MAGILVILPILVTYEIVKFIIVKAKVLHFANVVTPEWIEHPIYFRYITIGIAV